MEPTAIQNEERRETAQELSEPLFVVQKMGRRLANETHGEDYDLVRELNDLLHQTREKLTAIQLATRRG